MGLTGARSCLMESPTLHEGVIGDSQIGRRSEFINQIQVADFSRRTNWGGDTMQTNRLQNLTIVLTGVFAFASTSAMAFESGFPGFGQPAGLFITATAGAPPPGIYAFNQINTYQATIVGPGAPNNNGVPMHLSVAADAQGFVYAPGWNFLGATYDAVIVQPFALSNVGWNPSLPLGTPPIPNTLQYGVRNTYVVPAELSWRLQDSGFFVKAGLGFQLPDGTITGPTGLNSIGSPWYTIQPEILFSYLKNGWTASANFSLEINTENTITHYTSGDVLHAEFQVLKRFGKWNIGPVGYYMGQVSNDRSSAYYNYAINVNRYNIYAAGLSIGYDFGGAQANIMAVDQFHADASGGTPRFPGGSDSASIANGWKVIAQLNWRVWAPDAPGTTPAMYRKAQ